MQFKDLLVNLSVQELILLRSNVEANIIIEFGGAVLQLTVDAMVSQPMRIGI